MAVQIKNIPILEPAEQQSREAEPDSRPETAYSQNRVEQRAAALEELYTAVSSFVVDSVVYEGTPKDGKYRLALLKHRLPDLKTLIALIDDLTPEEPRHKK